MKDSIGQEINDGDFVLKINGYDFPLLGVVHGGLTKGGKIRFVAWCYFKENSFSHSLIVIPRELAQSYCDKKIEWIDFRIEESDNAPYYVDLKIKWETSIEKVFQLHEKHQNN